MKACSYSKRTLSSAVRRIRSTIGSCGPCSGPPPRSSSQFALHSTAIGSPVSSDFGWATGKSSPRGASVSFS